MKVIEKAHPSIRSYTVSGGSQNLENFKKAISENKRLGVDIDFETKTSVSVSLQAGSARYGANNQSKYSKEKGLKFLSRDEMNYFFGEKIHHEYFKLLKKQGKPELIEHVKSIIVDAMYRFGLTEYTDSLTVYLNLPKELL